MADLPGMGGMPDMGDMPKPRELPDFMKPKPPKGDADGDDDGRRDSEPFLF